MQDLDRLVGFAGGDLTSFSRTCSCKLLGLDVDLADSWHGKRLIGRNSGERCVFSEMWVPENMRYQSRLALGLNLADMGVWPAAAAVCQTLLSNSSTPPLACASVASGLAIPSTSSARVPLYILLQSLRTSRAAHLRGGHEKQQLMYSANL
jgi:hypothetical protein